MRYAVVIPARYSSSRFPGKPLVDLMGKPMIQRVWEQCCKAVTKSNVYIATEDKLIKQAAEDFGAQVIMTSSECLTGTDRLAEANNQLKCDFLVNVQGDEPLINPKDIQAVIAEYQADPTVVVNAMCRINDEDEFRSMTVPKVVFSQSNRLMYMSRAAVPISKSNEFKNAYKQVCIYAFSKQHLDFFHLQNLKTPFEQIEDIEILRFLENDIKVKMVEVSSCSIAVDIPTDVDKVISALKSLSKEE